jgi:cysteine synthase
MSIMPDPQWLAARGLDSAPIEAELSSFPETAHPLGFTFADAANPHS